LYNISGKKSILIIHTKCVW